MSTHTFKPDMPPPSKVFGPVAWMRANLFSSWLNTLLTLLAFYLIYLVVPPILHWAILDANWVGTTRADCTKEGACWVFIQQRFGQFMYGYYPGDLRWRVDLTVWLAIVGVAPLFISRFQRKAIYGLSFLVLYPIIAFFLLHGGIFGLTNVATSQWGGLMLTLVIATVGIAGALPLGIVLALGRRSNMPAIRVICVTFIEFWRGVPLITVLFMSSVMLPLFLPEGMGIDKLLRALIGVILPQALKLVIPGIVNTFIALFKDTSLVIIIGLFDLLNSVKQAAADPKWLGMATEGYVFAALVFWIFCFGMSRYSIHLEHKLDTGHKR